jgi:hypothetical protein
MESAGQIQLGGEIDTTGARTITVRNTGSNTTSIGSSDSGFALDQAEVNRLNATRVVVDSRAQNVTIGAVAIDANTGPESLRFLTTGQVNITGKVSGGGTGVLQIGGNSIADPSGLIASNTLAQRITLDIGTNESGPGIDFRSGTLDLRAQKIVFGRSALINRVAGLDNPGVALEVANAASTLYQGDATSRNFLTAKLLRVSYSDYALFQNTAGPAGGGVVLNDRQPPTTSDLALQLFSTGDNKDNSFALFGRINGFIGRAAGILPNENLEISSGEGTGRVIRITQSSSRVNGCVIGSPDKGCLVTDPPRPNFSISDERQSQLFGATENAELLFNPLVGRANEGLFVDIVDAPVGIDTLQCEPGEENCPRSEERK